MGSTGISAVSSTLGVSQSGQSNDVEAGLFAEMVKSGKDSFSDMMNMVSSQAKSQITLNAKTQTSQNYAADGVQTTSATSSFQSKGVQVSSKSKAADQPSKSTVDDAVSSYADDVKEVLKETLGVTDEEIEDAMETLGLSYADLTDLSNLANLVSELTGVTDIGDLLCNGDFQQIMQDVTALSDALLENLGVTRGELTQLLSEAAQELDPNAVDVAADTVVDADAAGAVEVIAAEPQADEANAEDVTAQTAVAAESVSETADAVEEAVLDVENSSSEESEGDLLGQSQTAADRTQDKNASDDGSADGANAGGTQVEQTYSEVSAQATAAGTTAAQFDIDNIIQQIVDYTRMTTVEGATTLEMQLSPEHLGKLYLELTAKAGEVTAHIMVQDEAVRQALEQQLVNLRSDLNDAGVKVTAVEVTVGSHEFEKNLEENGREDERQAEEQEKAASSNKIRRINLNSLDELSGLMSEEETLVAQMMAADGNRVDFTA